MRRLQNIVTNPRLFAAWAILVLLGLTATYFADPYIFGFTILILAGISVGVALIGLSVALSSKSAGWRTRASIIVSVAVTAAALLGALGILRTIKWG